MTEISDIAILDYWVGGIGMLVACLYFLFQTYVIGILIYLFSLGLFFFSECAEFLIEEIDSHGEVIDARLYRPSPFKPFLYRNSIVSGPFIDRELYLLKQDIGE